MSKNNDFENTKETQLVKKLESGQRSKRSLENPVNVECKKKSKVLNSILWDKRIDLSTKLKEIGRLSRKKLEELVVQVYCDEINNRSIINELNRGIKKREQEMTSLKEKIMDVETQIQNLSTVQNNVSKTLQMPNRKHMPVYKIRRNMGVQVNTVNMKYKQSLMEGTNSIAKESPNSFTALDTVSEKLSIACPVLKNTMKIIDLTDEDTSNETIPITSTSTAGSEQMVVPYQFTINNQQVNTNFIQTSEEATPKIVNKLSTPKETQKPVVLSTVSNEHPAPLLISPTSQLVESSNNPVSPILQLKIYVIDGKLILEWDMLGKELSLYEKIVNYQLCRCKDTSDPPSTANWENVDEFVALPLPMTYQFYKCDVGPYYYAMYGIDAQSRVVAFSSPVLLIFQNA